LALAEANPIHCGSFREYRSLRAMFRIVALTVAVSLMLPCSAERIKKPPPTPAEAERIASDMAKNDSLLRPGDIVATDRGFFVYRALGADGVSGDFVAVPNPLAGKRNPAIGK
jgi:hypothetical protein